MRGLAATVAATILVIALPAPARAAEPVEFMDMRPAIIDLDHAEADQRWSVSVLDGLPGRRHHFFLEAAFSPARTLEVEPRSLRLNEGEVGTFVLTLRRKAIGSGELILSGGGVIVRRSISTAYRPAPVPPAISSLQFAGVRMSPFSAATHIGDVVIPDARGATTGTAPAPIGILTSRRGDTAEVVRRGNTLEVAGGSRPGEYQGTVDLLPGRPGGDTQGTLRIRDLPVWPFLVLVLGLLIVHLLDRYQQRERPRHVLDLRLARLHDRARQAQQALNGTYRITASPQEPALLLDHLTAAARRRFDDMLTDGERAGWDVGGTEYLKIAGLVDAFETLTDRVNALSAERFARASGGRIERALDASPVGEVLRGGPLYSASDLSDAIEAVHAAREYLRSFHRLYRQATEIGATDVLAKLTLGPEDLAALDAEVQDRYRAWESDPITQELPRAAAPRREHVQISPWQANEHQVPVRRRRWPVLITAAAVLLLTPCLALALSRNYPGGEFNDGLAGPPAASQPATGGDGPPGEVPPTRPTTPPELPTAALEPDAPEPQTLPGPRATTWYLVFYGTMLPLVAAGAAAAVVMLMLRLRRPRRPRLDSTQLDRRVRRSDRKFALLGGTLVVLSGMSVLYVANPTFGSVGDYLTVALWGTAFGEGLTLARRLWPSPAARA